MTWSVEWDERARKELRTLDRLSQRDILRYMRDRIATNDDPRRFGKQLGGDMQGLWRYRMASYRMVCRIEDTVLVVLVLRVGHRSAIYDKPIR